MLGNHYITVGVIMNVTNTLTYKQDYAHIFHINLLSSG